MNKDSPIFRLRCQFCGMPLAEGSLMAYHGGLACELCFSQQPDNMVCDFCLEPEPAWLYQADLLKVASIIDDEELVYNLGHDWAVCNRCTLLLESDRVDELIEAVLVNKMRTVSQMERTVATQFIRLALSIFKHPPTPMERR